MTGGEASDRASEGPHGDAAESPPTGVAAILNFVAHPDDDLLFLSPDLLHAIQAGGNLRTVYLTAGDSGLDATYWQGRERGVRAAYAAMAGVADAWTQSDAGVTGHPIPVFTLNEQRTVSLAFMRLPDGCSNGLGFSSTGYQSLQRIWTGSTATIEAADKSSTYTLPTLISTLAFFITSFQPECINTLDYRRTYGDGDHSDHHTVGYMTRSAMAHCSSSVACVGYEGYPVIPLPPNLSDADQKAKQSAFFTYAEHDTLVRDLVLQSDLTPPYDLWLGRQYRLNDPRTLGGQWRGLMWRGAHRVRRLAWAVYARLRPVLVRLPFFPVLRRIVTRSN